MANIDIDLEEFSKDTLIKLIQFAHENDYTFNQAINISLEKIIKTLENQQNNESNL